MGKRIREVKIQHTMLTQNLDVSCWNWEPAEQIYIQNQDIAEMGRIILKKLENKGIKVLESYICKHDKDVTTGWNETLQQETVEYKQTHVHDVLRFAEPVFLVEVAEAVGLKPEYVEKPLPGRYSYDNMLAYPIHAKYPERYPYSVDEVITIAGKDYKEVYKDRKVAWDKGRAKKQAKQAKLDVEWLEEKILTGEVKRSQVLLTDAYFAIYAQNKRRCEDAFDTYAERKIYKTIQALENGEFKVSVFFVTGRPGEGKSYFTDQLAKKLQAQAKDHGEEWEICSVASNNPFDDYRGEEILVMDDLRGMSLTASDWLKLLDPDRISMGSARYHNKKMACRVIIINSEKDVLDFFFFLKGMGGAGAQEAMDQFVRRILARVMVYRYEDTRRVLIGDRTETEPYREQVQLTHVTLKNTFSDDCIDMDYEDALQSLALYVGVMNKWNTREERIAFNDGARLRTHFLKNDISVDDKKVSENSEN